MKVKTISKIKFDDRAIDKIVVDDLDFSFVDKNGNNKFRRQIIIPFDVPKRSFLKGLKLCIQRDTGSKLFWLLFWFQGKSYVYSVGKRIPGSWGVSEVEDKLLPIVRSHTNDKGHWIKSPIQSEIDEAKKRERLIEKDQYVQAERKTINEVIIELMKANMPKIKAEGTLCAKSIREQSRFLIGYNKRSRFLSYSDNESGNGLISFRPNYAKRKPAPEDWDQLFSWYPSGKGIILDPKKNSNRETAIFDNDLGKTFIDELTTGRINQYLKDKPSYSYKKNCLTAIKTLWNFASYSGFLGEDPGIDPTLAVQIKRPTEYSEKAINSKYNDKAFSVSEIGQIFDKLDELSSEYPFASENIKLVFLLGQRQEEVFKLKKKDIQLYNTPIQVQLDDGSIEKIFGQINFRKGTTKRRNKGKIKYITEPVKDLLDQIRDIYKRPGYEQYRLVPWLFPSPTRIDKQRLNNQESGYIRSNLTRLRSTKGCWNTLREDLGIEGVVRMARKTLVTLGKDAGLTNKQMKYISHHDQEKTIDIHYDKGMIPEIQKNEGIVAKIYKFQKKKIA